MSAEETLSPGGSTLAGAWSNTNPAPKLIRRVVFSKAGDSLALRVSSTGAFGPKEWGTAPAFAFCEPPQFSEATAFTAKLMGEGLTGRIQAYVVKGVLVIISLTRFSHGAETRAVFMKDFFYRESQ